MRNKKATRSIINALTVVTLSISAAGNAYAELIPSNNSPFYYQMGGGQSMATPAYQGTQSVPLHVEGDVGLGYNCGVFNPTLAITNSLNAIRHSFQAIQASVLNNATAAVTQFPMYALSRADPSLYNLLNNGLLGAREDLRFSTKSCQQMQSEIAKGQNPYNDWLQVSLGHDWTYKMSLAQASRLNARSFNALNADINQVRADVEQANGDKGVPWVHGIAIGRNAYYAGGRDQPRVLVIRDAAIAGYNVMLQSERDYDDVSSPVKNEANAHVVETWTNPSLAATWLVNVVGDVAITTYAAGDKQSSPGVGLLPDHHVLADKVIHKIQGLVSNQATLSLEDLKEVSAPGVMINTAVIQALRQQTPVTQSILVNKLGQEIAAAVVIDKALLARQLLQEGAQVPAIYANAAAQTTLKHALARLDQAINGLLFNVRVRKELVSDTVAQLLTRTQAEQMNQSSIQATHKPASLMQQGALKDTH